MEVPQNWTPKKGGRTLVETLVASTAELSREAYLSEAALWTKWTHMGKLQVGTRTRVILGGLSWGPWMSFNSQLFNQIIKNYMDLELILLISKV